MISEETHLPRLDATHDGSTSDSPLSDALMESYNEWRRYITPRLDDEHATPSVSLVLGMHNLHVDVEQKRITLPDNAQVPASNPCTRNQIYRCMPLRVVDLVRQVPHCNRGQTTAFVRARQLQDLVCASRQGQHRDDPLRFCRTRSSLDTPGDFVRDRGWRWLLGHRGGGGARDRPPATATCRYIYLPRRWVQGDAGSVGTANVCRRPRPVRPPLACVSQCRGYAAAAGIRTRRRAHAYAGDEYQARHGDRRRASLVHGGRDRRRRYRLRCACIDAD